VESIETHRTYHFSIAYRMLGKSEAVCRRSRRWAKLHLREHRPRLAGSEAHLSEDRQRGGEMDG